jgi:ParB family chromosome partitioning protein
MRQLKRIPIADLRPDPEQPRKSFDEAALLALADNMKQHGQAVPLIVHDGIILDGERRWRASSLVNGLTALDALVLEARPSATELHLLQMSLDVHRSNLTAMERSDFLYRIKQENNWSISELAEKLNMKQPLVTKLLKFQDGCDELRAALNTGTIDQDKAYAIIGGETDHAKQRELLKQASSLTREQVRVKARSGGEPVELKTSVARFPLPSGTVVTVQGRKLSLGDVILAITQALRELKRGQADHFDVATMMNVMRDRSRAGR